MSGRLFSNHYKYIAYIAVCLCFILALSFTLPKLVAATRNEAPKQKIECFTSIRINSGETLWSISKRYYSNEYQSVNHYIKKIMELNHMTSDKVLEGTYLIIPYYTEYADE